MKIQVFAVLKEYFDKEFELADDIKDIGELKTRLSCLNQEADGVLNISRFAINNEFVNSDHVIQAHDTICIFPPSSGG